MIHYTEIWKFPLWLADDQRIEVPDGTIIRSVGSQDGKLFMWCEVTPSNPRSEIRIDVFGTGHTILAGPDREFVGTVLIDPYVWHIFRRWNG